MRLSDLGPRTVFFDTETHLITQANPAPPLVCLQYAQGDQEPAILGGSEDGKRAAHALFRGFVQDEGTTLVAHNGFYDYSVMFGLNDYYKGPSSAFDGPILTVLDMALRGRIRDTLTMAKLNAIEFDWLGFDRMTGEKPKFNLAYLCRRFTGKVMEGKDTTRLRYAEMDGTPPELWPEEFRRYALDDINDLRPVFYALCNNEYPDERFQTAVYWVFRVMELWGIYTDKARVDALKAKILPFIGEATSKLVDKGYMRPGEWKTDTERLEAFIVKLCEAKGFEPPRTPTGKVSMTAKFLKLLDSPLVFDKRHWQDQQKPTRDMAKIKAEVEAWYTSRGLDVPKVEKKRIDHDDDDWYGAEEEEEEAATSTSRDALEATDNPELRLLAEIGKLQTLQTTFIPTFEQGYTYPIRPYWNGLVATGRPSCTKPNLLNQPREIQNGEGGVRECYKARPGYVFLDPDYSQAELCSLAQVCYDKFGHSVMLQIIKSGKDLHTWFAAMICGESYETVLAGVASKVKKYVDLRQLAKAANFGFPGGLGIKKFVKWARKTYNVVLTEAQVKDLKETWLSTFPEVRQMFAWVNEQVKRAGKRFTITQHRSNRRRGGLTFCNGNNTLFQGLTADGAKNALLLILRACHTPGDALHGSRIVAFVYDEILVETPRDNCHEASIRLVELMKIGMEEYTPDCPATATCEAMLNWSKKAKAVYVNDRLVPFDEL